MEISIGRPYVAGKAWQAAGRLHEGPRKAAKSLGRAESGGPLALYTFGRLARAQEEVSMISLLTGLVWLGVLAVGVFGLVVPFPRPTLTPELAEIRTEFLKVEPTQEPLVELKPEASARMEAKAVELPSPAAALPVVSRLTPAIVFPLPVEGPVRVADAGPALLSSPAPRREAARPFEGPAVQSLTWGRGDGKQPPPEYPRRAVKERQQGEVKVHFSVGADGRVVAAEAIEPSPWPLLNDAALRAIREQWRFGPGPRRRFEVAICFRLQN